MWLFSNLAFSQYCITSQQMCIAMEIDPTGNKITMNMTISNSVGWAAIGTGKSMSNSDMIVVWKTGSQVIVSTRYSSGESLPNYVKSKITPLPQYKNLEKSYIVSFTRPIAAGEIYKTSITKGTNSFIYALGDKSPSTTDMSAPFVEHTTKGTFEYNVLTGGVVKDILPILHGYGLIVLWIIFTPISVILARYFKHIGHKWFIAHSLIQFITISCTAVLGLMMENNYNWTFKSTHEIVGFCIVTIGVVQLMSGLYIHLNYDPSRSRVPTSDKAHGIVGFLIWFMSIYQMVTGLRFSEDDRFRLYIFCAIAALMFCLMAVLQFKRQKHGKIIE
eukprot:NODE_876_length_3515_cov_0.125293.p2 type:complete len:332 gc:universal NODE_876_length_3515_cov_0.125293:2350-3345(+)